MLQIVIQARLRTHTPEAYALISNMMFTQQEYEDLLRLYNSIDDRGKQLRENLRRGNNNYITTAF